MKLLRSWIKGYDLPLRQLLSMWIYNANNSFLLLCDTYWARFLLWRFGVKFYSNLKVSGPLRIQNRGKIIIGSHVRINSGSRFNFVGGDRRTNFWVGRDAVLKIGNRVGLSNTTIVSKLEVIIRDDTLIGGGCDIYDNDFHEIMPDAREARRGNIGLAPVVIGPRAFVGGHTIILKGVTIGEGAVIGAGSLVAKDVPPYQVWAGRPAQFVKHLPTTQKERV